MNFIIPTLEDNLLICKFTYDWDMLGNSISAEIELEEVEKTFKGKYTSLIYDFTEVSVINFTGVSLITQKARKFKKNKIDFKIINVNDSVRSILKLVHMTSFFNIDRN